MSAYNEIDAKIPGLKYGVDYQVVETWKAGEAIDFGYPVFSYAGDDDSEGNFGTAWKYHLDTSEVTFDADFDASDTITVTVNGVEGDTVTYDTSHDNTMDLIVASIEAVAPTATVTLTDATDNRKISIFIPGTDVTASYAIAGGSTVGSSVATSSAQVFVGVSLFTQKEPATIGGDAYYETSDAMNVLTKGKIWAVSYAAVNSTDTAYVETSGANKGKFGGNSSDYDTGAIYRSTITEAGTVLVEVRGSN